MTCRRPSCTSQLGFEQHCSSSKQALHSCHQQELGIRCSALELDHVKSVLINQVAVHTAVEADVSCQLQQLLKMCGQDVSSQQAAFACIMSWTSAYVWATVVLWQSQLRIIYICVVNNFYKTFGCRKLLLHRAQLDPCLTIPLLPLLLAVVLGSSSCAWRTALSWHQAILMVLIRIP